jgi:RTX calcium-binding nonapeptide repeat (4 copies)
MFQDVLQGSEGTNALFGADADDFLIGWAGRDTLEGGLARTTSGAGDDRDSFVFRDASRLPQDPRLARRVVAYLNEMIEWESEAAEEREQVGRGVAPLIAVNPDDRAA